MLKQLLALTLMAISFGAMSETTRVFNYKGVEIIKPSGWHWTGYKTLKDATAGQEGIKSRPIITITKHIEPYDDLNSSIYIRKADTIDTTSAKKTINGLYTEVMSLSGRESILYPPIPVMIDNHEGYTFRYKTTFTVNGVDYTSINETTAVKPNDETFYFFEISVPANNGLADIEQAHESVKSVIFTP